MAIPLGRLLPFGPRRRRASSPSVSKLKRGKLVSKELCSAGVGGSRCTTDRPQLGEHIDDEYDLGRMRQAASGSAVCNVGPQITPSCGMMECSGSSACAVFRSSRVWMATSWLVGVACIARDTMEAEDVRVGAFVGCRSFVA